MKLTPEQLQQLLSSRQWCYVIPEAQDITKYGGYVPSLVFENVTGHWPMLGQGEHAAPWVWGKTLAEAQQACDHNNKCLGLTHDAAMKIVMSTMACEKDKP